MGMDADAEHPSPYLSFWSLVQSAQFGTEEKTHPHLYLSFLCIESCHYNSFNKLPLSELVPFYISTG